MSRSGDFLNLDTPKHHPNLHELVYFLEIRSNFPLAKGQIFTFVRIFIFKKVKILPQKGKKNNVGYDHCSDGA